MKKSEAYRIAQLAVLKDESISSEDKLFILSELMGDENMAQFCEKREEAEE